VHFYYAQKSLDLTWVDQVDELTGFQGKWLADAAQGSLYCFLLCPEHLKARWVY